MLFNIYQKINIINCFCSYTCKDYQATHGQPESQESTKRPPYIKYGGLDGIKSQLISPVYPSERSTGS